MILKINTFKSAKYISNLYSKTTLIYNTNTTKRTLWLMTILYQYNPDVSFHKDSLYTYPWNFSFHQETTSTSNINMPCVHIDRCVCTYIYIPTYMHSHGVTTRTYTDTNNLQANFFSFSLFSTVPRVFSSNYISVPVINIILRQQATSACKAKKD